MIARVGYGRVCIWQREFDGSILCFSYYSGRICFKSILYQESPRVRSSDFSKLGSQNPPPAIYILLMILVRKNYTGEEKGKSPSSLNKKEKLYS